jgi:hypothetical protein
MHSKGFIGSFALSALLVSAAGALLVVMGALLAFDGFPGPSLGDPSKLTRVASLSAGEQTEPQLVLDPPTASALEPGPGSASGTGASSDLADPAAAPLDATAAGSATTLAAPVDDAPSGAVPTEPPVDGTGPELPGDDGGVADASGDAIGSGLDRLAPVTEGVREALGGADGGPGLSLP